MAIMGTCKECGDETMDYCCTACMGQEIEELKAEIEKLNDELLVALSAARCRICDTDKCGTMYCYKCYHEMVGRLEARIPDGG